MLAPPSDPGFFQFRLVGPPDYTRGAKVGIVETFSTSVITGLRARRRSRVNPRFAGRISCKELERYEADAAIARSSPAALGYFPASPSGFPTPPPAATP